jgi:hypothetical protein
MKGSFMNETIRMCLKCNIKLSEEDKSACNIVKIDKPYCQDCLLNVCRHIFVDDKGLLNDTWDIYEKFIYKSLTESFEEPDKFFTETYDETMRRYEK